MGLYIWWSFSLAGSLIAANSTPVLIIGASFSGPTVGPVIKRMLPHCHARTPPCLPIG